MGDRLAPIIQLIRKPIVLLAGALVLAGGAGFFTAQAVGISSQAAARTVTVNVGTGETGPQGPAGPAGPPGQGISVKGSVATPGDLPKTGNKSGDTFLVQSDGSIQTWDGTKWVSSGPIPSQQLSCPTGFDAGELVLNAPGGQQAIWTCLKTP